MVFLAAVVLLLGGVSVLGPVKLLVIEEPVLLEGNAQLEAGVFFRAAGVDVLGPLDHRG